MPRPDAAIAYREMARDDIQAGLQLCRASQWNQLQRDWEILLALSPRGARVAVKDQNIVGTVATVTYAGGVSWIAMVLVAPAARGGGIGTQLVREGIALLADVPHIRLDATPAGREVYQRLGFKDEYPLSRMIRAAAGGAAGLQAASVRRMTAADLPRVRLLDQEVFGVDRGPLLEFQLAGAPEYAWVHESDGRLTGFVMGRHGHNAEHLGPVTASDQTVAKALVATCLQEHPGTSFVLDISRHSREWVDWIASLGFRELRPFMRMCHGHVPAIGAPARQWAVFGPEFG
ncbi:MAG: GNAT family N-acetyltransferase [Gemmatimonadaceae bacterium]